MLIKLINILVALGCLGYYVKSRWPGIKQYPLILTLLICGDIIFIFGILLGQNGATLRLLGPCLFLTGLAVDSARNRKDSKEKPKND